MKVLNCFMFIAVLITACTSATPDISTVSLTATEQVSSKNYGVVKSSLEIVRNGKTYELLLGYGSDNLLLNDAPTQETPSNFSANSRIDHAKIEWRGDIDNDGEAEYLVEIVYCGGKCSYEVQVIHYDLAKDEYRALDSIKYLHYVSDYQDIDADNNPEVVTSDYDYNLQVGGCGGCVAVSPIKIYHFDGKQGKFVVVTNRFPALVRKNADAFLISIKKDYQSDVNDLMLASYLYDMYILGKQNEGISTYKEVCKEYVQPKMDANYWTCDKYLAKVLSVLDEMKIGSE